MDSRKKQRILAVGSLPPPLGGTSVSFQAFCDEIHRYSDEIAVDIIDAAPRYIKEDTRILTSANLSQAGRVLRQVLQKAKTADLVVVVGSHQFLLTMGSIILILAKLFGKKCYFRSFGYLDVYYHKQPSPLKWLFRQVMHLMDGLFVETQLVQSHLTPILGQKVKWVPGYRHMPLDQNDFPQRRAPSDEKLRLVFISQVREEKGIFVLLESLRQPAILDKGNIFCDIYGPIFPSISERFEFELAQTPNATYKGVLDPDDAVATLARYDVFVFPTFWRGEGHSGVLMEAMMAGTAVITTQHRSIPELVEHRVNGLLAKPQDVPSLVEMINLLDTDRELLCELARANWERRKRHAATTVVAEMLAQMTINLSGAAKVLW